MLRLLHYGNRSHSNFMSQIAKSTKSMVFDMLLITFNNHTILIVYMSTAITFIHTIKQCAFHNCPPPPNRPH
jgi:hypothetical protein